MPLIFSWILNGIYVIVLLAASPFLIYRRINQGKYRRGWREKLTGRLHRKKPQARCLWFHAVSVGEVVQLQKVIEDAERRFPDAELLISVTTETGHDVALAKYPRHTVSYFPLDFSWAVHRALTAIRPELVVLVELELWPNFIMAARRLNIPVMMINGRMGAKSYRGYSRIKPLMRSLLSNVDLFLLQNQTYADRLISLGASPDRVIVSGNIKYDRVESNRRNPKTVELRTFFGISDSDVVFIAGSTQDPEETYAIDAWVELRKEFKNLRLILVPRHKERFEDVASLVTARGLPLIRRSSANSESSHVSQERQSKPTVDCESIGLLDTLGELADCWGIADIAFVGGSLTNRGGQNMIEPAGYGATVLFGPNTWNFKDITESLLSHNAARVIDGSVQLRETVRDLLSDSEQRLELGRAAQRFVGSQQGAAQRTLDQISQVLERRTARFPTEQFESPKKAA